MAKSPTYPDVLKQAKKVTDKTPLTKPGKFTVSTVAARLGSLDPTPPQVAEVVSVMNKADPNRLGKRLLTGMIKDHMPVPAAKGGLTMEPAKALEWMNAKFAVTYAGGDVVILREHYDAELGHDTVSFMKPHNLALYYANWSVDLGGGNSEPLFPWWVRQPERRTYAGVVFAPGREVERHYNLWRGWAVEADPKASCKLFKQHVFNIVCNGDKKLYRWVLDWLADAVQEPDTKPGTALVLKGDEGIGKGVFAQYMGKLYGPHFTHLTHSEHLVGRFNNHAKGCAFMFGDECFFAGDKKHEGVLKGLITEPTVQIEMKFIDKFPVANRIRLVMASNSEWVVPAGKTARRFCVLSVPDTRMDDTVYFDKLIDEMEGAGPAALMHFLLKRKITSNLRIVPKTEALLDQKLKTLDPAPAYWFGMLADGVDWHFGKAQDGGEDAGHWTLVCDVYAGLIKFCRDKGERHPPTSDDFGRALKKFCPLRDKGTRTLHTQGDDGHRVKKTGKAYWFPPLAVCRRVFEVYLKQKIEWDDEG